MSEKMTKKSAWQKEVDVENARRAAKKLKQTTTIRKSTLAIIKKINKVESFPELHNIETDMYRLRINKVEAEAIDKATKTKVKEIKAKKKWRKFD